MPGLDWIIFDLGGIFVGESGPAIIARLAREFGGTPGQWARARDEYHRRLTCGELTLLQAYASVLPELGVDAWPADALAVHLEEFKRLSTAHDPEAVSLLDRLRGACGVACLTNTEIETAQICHRGGLFERFDRVYISVELGCMKPEPEIYRRALADLGCAPDRVFFVDDRPDNVKGARREGMRAELFRDVPTLEARLKELM